MVSILLIICVIVSLVIGPIEERKEEKIDEAFMKARNIAIESVRKYLKGELSREETLDILKAQETELLQYDTNWFTKRRRIRVCITEIVDDMVAGRDYWIDEDLRELEKAYIK